ncbi:peptidoglycan-binding domain-containing protein [Streptomyces curacoi]|uniref:peptidoglycan-binding domain-containing protein n=1 Tax=Streptomyces curacoi TaxID=146536 RepID=UPI0007C7EA51|nr:peptidoglycan-binding domain-containing protein [Streptomyces curacoi]
MTEPRGTEGAKGPEGPDSPTGRLCPECGAPRAADNTPSCDCAERVAEALRDARTAEAAAAEDFDPLRIRPYVELAGDGATMPLRAVPPAGPRPAPPPAGEPTSTLATPSASPSATPGTRDLNDLSDRARRRRRTVLLGVGGAIVTVLAAAGLASGLLTYETPSRDTALPDDIRASIPVPSTGEASEEPSPSGPSARPTQAPAAPSPTRSASPTPSPSRSSASPAPSPSAEPTKAPASAGAEASGALEESIAGRETTPPTLRRGDRGPEVTELELRLTQLGLYTREAQGSYNEGVEDAVSRYQWARGIQPEEYGVYDLATRERLESETTEP